MATNDFFRNSYFDNHVWFNEGLQIVTVAKAETDTAINAATSIDTSGIDTYRQGIELTRQKYFDAGIIKIHAGEPGHMLKQNRFGMDKNYSLSPGSSYDDIDYFNPVTYIKLQAHVSSYNSHVMTFPIITCDNNQLENYNFDGIIEPLTIRAKASFFSTDVPFEAHDVRGTMMSGNSDLRYASDKVVTVDYFNSQSQFIPYLDTLEMINEIVHIDSFNDIHYLRNSQSSSSYSDDMNDALAHMLGSTDNYISCKQRSSTCGWDYDINTMIGTDSLAFGGMTH